MELVILLFVLGPLAAGLVAAAFCRADRLRDAAVAGVVGGAAVGVNLAAFGGFVYGPILGAVGGMLQFALVGPRPVPRDWSREPRDKPASAMRR